ncbi:MAG: metallophosphoesterase family protein [Bacillota bacterium]
MRVAIFSDVHGNVRALEAVLADMAGRADVAVCAGDVAWGGPFPERVIARLRQVGFACVVGNTDLTVVQDPAPDLPWIRWARSRLSDGDLAFLEHLPLQYRIEPPGSKDALLVVHSTPDDPARALPHYTQEEGLERLFGSAGAAVVVHGHDHWPSVAALHRVTVVGAGAVGLPFDGDPRACYAVMTYDPPTGWHAEHRRVAYDVEAAAAEAEQAGMPGAQRWGVAIRRGLPPDRVTL